MNDFEPLDFKKEGIVLDYKTAGVPCYVKEDDE